MPEIIQTMDYHILYAIIHLRTDGLTHVFMLLTQLGNGGLLWLVLAAVLLIKRRTRPYAAPLLLALLLALLFGNFIIKDMVQRPRPFVTYPELVNLVQQSGYSFPSAHTATSFASATAVWLSFRAEGRHWLGVCCLLAAAGIALSRLYLCVHYPSDVLAGLVLGIATGCFSVWLCRKIQRHFSHPS